MNEPVACGWYTPDYSDWVSPLVSSLEERGIKHDFIAVHAMDGFWEDITLLKPSQALAALQRHPERTILFLDVDCIVKGTKEEILNLCNIQGDIGIYIRSRFSRRGRPRFRPRSGTLILRQTEHCVRLLKHWESVSAEAPRFEVDEATLLVSLGQVPGLTVTFIPQTATAIRFDNIPDPLIFHSSASVDKHTNRLIRALKGQKLFRGLFAKEM